MENINNELKNEESLKNSEKKDEPKSHEHIEHIHREEKQTHTHNETHHKEQHPHIVHHEHHKDEIEIRKDKVIRYFKEKKNWIYYSILAILVYISVFIRTRNMPLLKDVTTGTWTLGPDLDPFLFLRWAKYIVENGSLMVVDTMRYVPLGYETARELRLHSFLVAWFHNVLSFFGKSTDVTYSAIIFPVFMFALTAIAFFLFVRKVFYKESESVKNIIALLATAIFIVVPSLLSRTIAGIPEKESAGFFFIFLSLYLFLEAFTSKKLKRGIFFGILSGISTGLLSLNWGGIIFVLFPIPIMFLFAFLIGEVKKKDFIVYLCWIVTSFAMAVPYLKTGIIKSVFSLRGYTIGNLLESTTTLPSIAVLFVVGLSLFLMERKYHKIEIIREKIKIPKEGFYLISSIIVALILMIIILGPASISNKISDVKNSLVSPLVSRFGLTVAENKQPYYVDWKGEFGPILFKIPLFFWMFFVGSILLFYDAIKNFRKKDKFILSFAYLIFLSSIIFSRYSETSILNGTSGLSILIYFGGPIFFIYILGHLYYKNHQKGEFEKFKEINPSYVLYLSLVTFAIISARGAIRFIMVLGAVAPIAISFLVVKTSKKYLSSKEETMKFFVGALAVLLILASLNIIWTDYKQDKAMASGFGPGPYQWQWQKAMAWVRENTSENAVFAHWWDYGYWVQSIGERATMLDGANNIGYWNHLMGRHGLTGPDERKALELFYAHNVTHFLIDSTDIGKYTAFSSIGSDENYDRFSWINPYLMDTRQIQETNNQTLYIYGGSSSVDEDITWNNGEKEIFIPARSAGVAGIILRKNNDSFSQPEAVFVYKGEQYIIPIKYIYFNGKLYDFASGIEAGIFLFPALSQNQNGGVSINEIGALLYLSKRTVNSQLARLYLFGQENEYFKLAHQESSYVVDSLRSQGVYAGEFLYYQGVQGPIKIWGVSYPDDIELNPEFLRRDFPDPRFAEAKPGEY